MKERNKLINAQNISHKVFKTLHAYSTPKQLGNDVCVYDIYHMYI